MSSNVQRTSTTAQRALEWMRFDPVKFGLLAEGMTLEEEGALFRLVRRLWIQGPLPEQEVKRVTKRAFEVIVSLMSAFGDGLSFDLVEDARTYGQRNQDQRVEAGRASAAKRNDRSTTDERAMNDRSTVVLSKSVSTSKSQRGKERAPEVLKAEFIDACRSVIAADPSRMLVSERKPFLDFWTEPDKNGKMRFEDEKFFAHGRRMDTWMANYRKRHGPVEIDNEGNAVWNARA